MRCYDLDMSRFLKNNTALIYLVEALYLCFCKAFG
nr:MAG TPA: hypothetical protein [Caudoviricetes sp.]